MHVIKCDKCGRELHNEPIIKDTDLQRFMFIELCKDCSDIYAKVKKEYREYEKTLSEVFNDLLKNKADKLNEKYFVKKKRR